MQWGDFNSFGANEMSRRTGSYTQDHALPVGWLLLVAQVEMLPQLFIAV